MTLTYSGSDIRCRIKWFIKGSKRLWNYQCYLIFPTLWAFLLRPTTRTALHLACRNEAYRCLERFALRPASACRRAGCYRWTWTYCNDAHIGFDDLYLKTQTRRLHSADVGSSARKSRGSNDAERRCVTKAIQCAMQAVWLRSVTKCGW